MHNNKVVELHGVKQKQVLEMKTLDHPNPGFALALVAKIILKQIE